MFIFFFLSFITPNHKADLDRTPRTPTPFKNALEKYGPIRPLVRKHLNDEGRGVETTRRGRASICERVHDVLMFFSAASNTQPGGPEGGSSL